MQIRAFRLRPAATRPTDPAMAGQKAMSFMGQDTNESVEPADDETGLPWLHTWNRVYLVVLINFAIWIALLVALTHFFS
jgi:hypothetical protein